jgi:WD40 repeat protein
MKRQRHIIMPILIICSLAFSHLAFAGIYAPMRLPGAKASIVMGEPMVEPLLEVGVMPVPSPSRRQIIDADKGDVCLQCHRMPYPTAPKTAPELGEVALSSIPTTHPGGWRLLTSIPHPFNKIAEGWSPDGKHIVYSINLFREDWDIWVMDANGKNRRPLVTGSTIDVAPDWSPDGKAIAFQSNRSGNNDIWMMDIASRKLTQLTTNPAEDTMPKWSPDGRKIVFQSNRSGNEEIWVLDIPTGGLNQLTNNPAKDENPVFSPKGGQDRLCVRPLRRQGYLCDERRWL